MVITYGLELFLNNNLKLMIYSIIGSVCNIFTETVIDVLVMAVLGGYHSQSDLGCLILTGSMIFIPIILSKYVFISHMHFIVFFLGIIVIYIFYAPCGGKYSNVKGVALLWIKTVVTLILFCGYLGGIFINRRWGIIVMLVSLMQGLSLIKMKRRISDE
ncbi:accessory gene regulator B family protein [Lachnospiraceae bacterium 56-18]